MPVEKCASPLQWSLVVEEFLWDLNDNHYYTVGYIDNTTILNNGKLIQIVSEVLQTALDIVQQWCYGTDLFRNPKKTVIITFIRKRDIRNQPFSIKQSSCPVRSSNWN
jgi:hypothetical protein